MACHFLGTLSDQFASAKIDEYCANGVRYVLECRRGKVFGGEQSRPSNYKPFQNETEINNIREVKQKHDPMHIASRQWDTHNFSALSFDLLTVTFLFGWRIRHRIDENFRVGKITSVTWPTVNHFPEPLNTPANSEQSDDSLQQPRDKPSRSLYLGAKRKTLNDSKRNATAPWRDITSKLDKQETDLTTEWY